MTSVSTTSEDRCRCHSYRRHVQTHHHLLDHDQPHLKEAAICFPNLHVSSSGRLTVSVEAFAGPARATPVLLKRVQANTWTRTRRRCPAPDPDQQEEESVPGGTEIVQGADDFIVAAHQRPPASSSGRTPVTMIFSSSDAFLHSDRQQLPRR